jgi:glycosyltransferase involved in cell wall biosynthesis
MRILHLDPDDMANPVSGGGPVRTFEIYRRLARRHEITVLTPTFPGSTPELVREGIRYVRLGRRIGDHGSSHHLTYLCAMVPAIRRFEHDLLVEDFMPPASATWTPIFRRRDRPLIASVQWFFARTYTRKLKLPFHWGEEYGVRLYDHFVVMSPSMATFINSRHRRADTRVIGNGVDDALFCTPARVGRGILYLGRIEINAKGLDLLLQAYARLPEVDRQPLILAGTVQQPEALQRLIDQTGLHDWVQVPGKYDAARRLQLLADCRFVVMPSRTETFGMTLAEANAAACVAITWDIAPMNEVAAAVCPRVPAFDIEAYAAAMRALLRMDDDELLRRGLAAREHAQQFDWDTAAERQERFYLEVTEDHARRLTHAKRHAG